MALPTVLFIGRIHPFRNPVNLVRAMALVVQRVPQARLMLAGRTGLTEPVQVKRELGLTDGQVQFLGETPHEQVVALMKTSHVLASWVTGPFKSLGPAPNEGDPLRIAAVGPCLVRLAAVIVGLLHECIFQGLAQE